MNDLAKQFLDTLRDPINEDKGRNYGFARWTLKEGKCSFCVGGIMCDIAVGHDPDRYKWEYDKVEMEWAFLDTNDEREIRYRSKIPEHILELFGIDVYIREFNEKQKLVLKPFSLSYREITIMNDRGIPWSAIADVIEIELLKKEKSS